VEAPDREKAEVKQSALDQDQRRRLLIRGGFNRAAHLHRSWAEALSAGFVFGDI